MALEFALKLRRLIEERDVTDSAVARAVGVAPSAINRWTTKVADYGPGESVRRPTALQVLALARYFNVSMEYLTDDNMEEDVRELTWQERAVVEIYRARVRIEGPEIMTPGEVAVRIEIPRLNLGPVTQPAGQEATR